MLTIGLISDTHSYLDPKIFEHFADCDEIWHAGDIGNLEVADKLSAFKPFKAVYGNIDGGKLRVIYPEHHSFVKEGIHFWITHIAGRPNAYAKGVKDILKKYKPQVLICGHSHILRVEKDSKYNNVLYINPGAAGKYGFHKVKTIIKFTIDKGKFTDMKVIELGDRAKIEENQ